MPIKGLGPHGERASALLQLDITETDALRISGARNTVAVVLHTTGSDWSKQQMAGIVRTLGRYETTVTEVIDCEFSYAAQNSALERLANDPPSAVISIPIGNTAVADAHRKMARAGAKVILLDNAPTGLLPGADYACVVSADNFGLGQIAAETLSPYLPQASAAGIISYGVDFFATHQREIAFRKWMAEMRTDVTLRTARFTDVNLVAPIVDGLISANPQIAGLFAVWDAPAIQAVSALRARGRSIPVTTIDLGSEAAIELARGGLIKGIGAQQPYDQGVAAGTAALLALAGRELPAWIALPGIKVTRENVMEAYQTVWHAPAPRGLVSELQGSRLN